MQYAQGIVLMHRVLMQYAQGIVLMHRVLMQYAPGINAICTGY